MLFALHLAVALAAPTVADTTALLASLKVTDEERAQLAAGTGVYRYDRLGLGMDDDNADGSREAGLSMMVVDAPPEAIWPHIEDCDAYVTYLPYVTGSTRSNYESTDTGATWTCAMELTTRGFVTRYSVDNTFDTAAGKATFGMSSPGSVLKAANGVWQTSPWPDDPGKTLLVYVFESRAAWWVPGFAKRMAADRGLSDVTRLLARQVDRAREATVEVEVAP